MRALAVILVLAAAGRAELGKDDRKAVRGVLRPLLAQRKAKERAKLAAALAPLGSVADIEAAVRLGPLYDSDPRKPRGKEKLKRFGNVVVGYTFEVDGETYRYAVDVPRGYDRDEATPVLLDPGHGSGAKSDDEGKAGFLPFFRGHCEDAGGKDWLVVRSEIVERIGPDARGLPEDTGNVIFQELIRDLAGRFHIDPDRIYVAGLSQTGFWAWMLGRMRPDRWAGLVPMSAISREVDDYPANFLNLPVYVLHGEADRTCRVAEPRRTVPLLARHGVDVKYVEIEGAGHDGGVWGGLGGGLSWLRDKTRARYPKRVSFSLQTERHAWCYWIRVDRIEKEGDGRSQSKPTAGIDGVIEGQTIRLGSDGVKRITLALSPEMLDLGKPITVVWNGKEAFQGTVEPSVETLLEFVHEKADWRQTFGAKLELRAP